jgi:hypothetical protein
MPAANEPRDLGRALAEGAILDDVKAFPLTPDGLATYRGVVRCPCGTPVLLHVETVWRNRVPSLLGVRLGGECCPGCGAALAPAVRYLGLFSPGWPAVPATAFSPWDACLLPHRTEGAVNPRRYVATGGSQ